MGFSKETAMMDLYIFNRIALSTSKTSEFNSAYSFVLLRDFCVVFEEIQNAFAKSITINKNVKKIRQNIKLFGKRGNLRNDGVYLKIRRIHEESFASYENNIGLFLDKDKIIGSTIYGTYIFLDSEFENPYLTLYDEEFKKKLRSFLMETIATTRKSLEPFVLENHTKKFYENLTPIEIKNTSLIKPFDVRAELFFNDSRNKVLYQTLKFRLLICLQELNFIIFIFNNFVHRPEKEFIDEYTFMRVLTRSLDSILKNLDNLNSHSKNEYSLWLDNLEQGLKKQIEIVVNDASLIKWASKYRNMVHYNTDSNEVFTNFYEVAINDIDFREKCYEVFSEVVLPLQKGISNFFIVTKEEQYSLSKMIYLKFKEKFHVK